VREILELLERDAHLSHETLATMTGTPVEQVAAQVAAWEESGVIRRYTAIVDWDRAAAERGDQSDDVVTAFIDVAVAPARSVGFDDVALRISRFPEVRSVYWSPAATTCAAPSPDAASARCRTSSPRSSPRSTGCSPRPRTSCSRRTSAPVSPSSTPNRTTACR
jgi:hypothetical protein